MDLNIIDQQSEEVKTFLNRIDELLSCVGSAVNNKPHINGEYFYTNKDVCRMLHISSRTLQEYRDKGLISYIKLAGKIIYRESDVQELLLNNYYPIMI